MEKSESIKELSAAMVKFQGEVPIVKFDEKVKVTLKSGGSYSFQYASMGAIKETCKPILAKHGLAVIQLIGEKHLTTMLLHESGEYISEAMELRMRENMSPQEIGSLVTYMKRYSYSAALGLVTDEDEDGNIASDNHANKLLDKPAVLQRLKMCKSLDVLKSIWTETKDKEDKEILAAVKDKQAELAPKPEIAENTKEFKTAIDWLLESPSNTMERLKRKYKLDDKVEQSLINAVKAAENGGTK